MPWRKERTAYRVWISEIMLQQTRVKTVVPYYLKWMKSYPDLPSLYEAKMERILKSWQGLGYYQRAVKIKATATIVKEKFNGEFPEEYSTLVKLPGIGDYTAKSILNFAFKKNHLAIDGNVFKIFSRFSLIPYPFSNSLSKPLIEKVFQTIKPEAEKIPLFNEALFELGALVCLREKPLCSICPIREDCLARKENRTQDFPVKIKKQLHPVASTSLVIFKSNKVLLRLREQERRMTNLWEFPTLEHHSFSPDNLPLIKDAFLKKYEISVEVGPSLGSFRHFYTKYKIHHHLYQATMMSKKLPPKSEMAFLSLAKIEQLPLTKANQKILTLLKTKKHLNENPAKKIPIRKP